MGRISWYQHGNRAHAMAVPPCRGRSLGLGNDAVCGRTALQRRCPVRKVWRLKVCLLHHCLSCHTLHIPHTFWLKRAACELHASCYGVSYNGEAVVAFFSSQACTPGAGEVKHHSYRSPVREVRTGVVRSQACGWLHLSHGQRPIFLSRMQGGEPGRREGGQWRFAGYSCTIPG